MSQILGGAVLGIREVMGGERAERVAREVEPFALAAEQRESTRLLLLEEPLDALWLARRLTSLDGPALAMGIASGRTITRGGTLAGRAVDECHSLATRARAGQTLATASLGPLASPQAKLRALDTLPVEGSGELIWADRASAAATHLPPLLELAERGSAFCGRAIDLRALERAWEEAAQSGDRRVALVSGEAGAGKTRLLARLSAELSAKGARVLYGRCLQEASTPYGPIVEALGATAMPASKRRQAAGAGPVREAMDEAERAEIGDLEMGAELTRRIASAGGGEPVLIVIDDLHWADRETTRLLLNLLEGSGSLTCLLIFSYRHSEVAKGSPLALSLQRLRRRPGTVDRRLGGLDSDELSDLAQSFIGVDRAYDLAELVDEILSETGGNPLFAGELLRSMSEMGAFDDGPSRVRTSEWELPDTVTETIRQRVERLGPDASEAPGVAAIIGAEFEPDVLEASLGWQPGRVTSTLDEAERAGLLERRRGGAVGFSHVLVVRALSELVGAPARGCIHRRVGEALEGLSPPRREESTEALARHWLEASPPDRDKAVGYSHAAARRAIGASTTRR